MATFDVAKLLNKITQDIPGINTVLKALAKWDVSALTDVPDGAMQATTDTNNRLTIKKKVSDSYTPVAKLMHDVDLLDGYHASASATANTVAVRNSSGALPGNITGNAATAATAVALAAGSVVPLNQGGTEATTASQARANLGAAGIGDFSAHIAKQASSSVDGHVKLSDAVNSTSGVAGGIAATPAAAKSAYDKAVAGINAAAAAQAAADNAQTTANTAQAAAGNAQTTANTAKAVTDKVSTTPAAGKIPLAGANNKLSSGWIDTFPQGTKLIFNQAVAPTGWVKQTSVDNATLRVVSGNGGGTGGSVNFNEAFSNVNVSSTTLTMSQMASHGHEILGTTEASDNYRCQSLISGGGTAGVGAGAYVDIAYTKKIGSSHINGGTDIIRDTGSSAPHSHSINIAVKYTDVIICEKA